MGLNPIVILITRGKNPCMVNKCKYVSKLHLVETLEEGYALLLKEFGNETEKPFVYCSDDNTESYLDQRYDELKDKFYFYNAAEQGRITYLQNKDNITSLGQDAGLRIPPKEIVDTGVLPRS